MTRTLDLVQSLLEDDEPASSLSEVAHRELRARIIALQLRPGELLTEGTMQRELGLGRTPIREAFSRLVEERLVVIRSRRGVFVSEISLPDLSGVYEIRAHLEGLAAQLAARRTDEMDAQLVQRIAELERLEAESLDYGELLALDYRMHQTVYRLSRNLDLQRDLTRYLNLSVRLILAVSERGGFPLADLSHLVGDFGDLFGAIKSRDAEAAEAIARAHVDASQRLVRDSA